ncbi:MAG: hypothetical protein WC596_02515 [Candidatus Shapirobacteria bacterium]
MKFSIKEERGQVALIVLLVSAVVLSLGLSVSRKTTVETKVDTDEELLKQAFNTAESSIDKYLVTGETAYSGGVGESATVAIDVIGNGTSLVSESLTEGKPAFFWLTTHNLDGSVNLAGSGMENIKICANNTADVGALKIENFYSGGTKVKRFGANLYSSDSVNDFDDRSDNCYTLTTQNGSLLLTVTPIFKTTSGSTTITVEKSSNFPAQGEDLTATGKVGDQTTGVSRKVRVRIGYKIPAFMLDALTTLQ